MLRDQNLQKQQLHLPEFLLLLQVVPKKRSSNSRTHTPKTPHFYKNFTTSPRKTTTVAHFATTSTVILTLVLYWFTNTRACNCTVNPRGCIDTSQNTPELSPVCGPQENEKKHDSLKKIGDYQRLSLK